MDDKSRNFPILHVRLLTAVLIPILLTVIFFSCPLPEAVKGITAPEFSPAGGVYSEDQTVSITCSTPGATIHYTTDGSVPNPSSPNYSAGIEVKGDGTIMHIQAIAINSGVDSPVVASDYAIHYQVPEPEITPGEGVFYSAHTVTISCPDPDAEIHYTLDGSTPTASSTLFSGVPVVIDGEGVKKVKALAVKMNKPDSNVVYAAFYHPFNQIPEWARSTTFGTTTSMYTSIAIDDAGNIYAIGKIHDNTSIGLGNGVTAQGVVGFYDNYFVAKYDASGTAQWAGYPIAASQEVNYSSLAVDAAGNIYVAGFVYGNLPVDFGNSVTVQSPLVCGGKNILLLKYNSSGEAQWARTLISGSIDTHYSSIAVDSLGNVTAGGCLQGDGLVDLGNGVTVQGTHGSGNFVLVRYNSSGETLWARTTSSGSTISSVVRSVTLDATGSIVSAGSMYGAGSVDFGNGVSVSGVLTQFRYFITKHSASGAIQWARTVVFSPDDSYVVSVTTDNSNNVIASGYIKGSNTPYDFGDGVTIRVPGGTTKENGLLLKYNSSGNAQWVTIVSGSEGSTYRSQLKSAVTDASGNIFVAGVLWDDCVYDFGNDVVAQYAENPITENGNPGLVKYNSSGTAQWVQTIVAESVNSTFNALAIDDSANVFIAGSCFDNVTVDFGNGVTVQGSGIFHNVCVAKY